MNADTIPHSKVYVVPKYDQFMVSTMDMNLDSDEGDGFDRTSRKSSARDVISRTSA